MTPQANDPKGQTSQAKARPPIVPTCSGQPVASSEATTPDKRLHQWLQELAEQAGQHPPKSKQRRQLLNQLIGAIQKSGKLYCRGKYQFPEELYREALQEAFCDFCRKIDRYNPKKAKVITWVNRLVEWRFIEITSRYIAKSKQEQSLDITISLPQSEESGIKGGISWLETFAPPQASPEVLAAEAIGLCLQEDLSGKFRQTHVRNFPAANFQAIALRRLAGQSWQDLSNLWGVPVPTLSVFYQRWCRRFDSQFREYL